MEAQHLKRLPRLRITIMIITQMLTMNRCCIERVSSIFFRIISGLLGWFRTSLMLANLAFGMWFSTFSQHVCAYFSEPLPV